MNQSGGIMKCLLYRFSLVVIFIAGLSIFAISCSSKKATSSKNWEIISQDLQEGIFSNRAQNVKHTILMLKLETNPLLKTLPSGTGHRIVNVEQAKQIEEEQTQLIESLKKISPEIKILFRYRMVLNALSVVVPIHLVDQVKALPGIVNQEKTQIFSRPQVNMVETFLTPQNSNSEKLGEITSVNFIGADKVHRRGLKGQGQKIGIIDTGVDYTHAMFGGLGTAEAYKAIDPSQSNDKFPNQKVVNGIDLVGTSFNGNSEVFSERVPRPDANPMDEAGHGTHVAGTVAGIGDGVHSYSGVAPEATLYAIKVFGARGSTTDEVVIAAMEWSADPNQDLDMKDQLDVVNLSLGSDYGTKHVMYSEAVENLSHGGTVVVAAAGNSGPQPSIVGSPSVSEEAISVAASIDGMDHNWKFASVRFDFESAPFVLAELVEGPASKKVSETGDVFGNIIYVGLANEDFSPEILEKIKGQVVLIDRGIKPFSEKLGRAAKAGAIGVVLANNQDGAPFAMGLATPNDKPIEIPAIMITKELGEKLKKEITASRKVQIHFKSEALIERSDLVDSITSFSSQGPRFEDALIKPEITAPGQNIVSAAMGGGSKSIKLSGTSMATPHIAGVVALLKQSHPQMNSRELKSLLMGTAKSIQDSRQQIYPVSMMGAGRVQVEQATHAQVISGTTGLSLGILRIEEQKTLRRSVDLQNISSGDLKLKVTFEGSPQISLTDQVIDIKSFAKANLNLEIKISSSGLKEGPNEVSGIVVFKNYEKEVFRIPLLALITQISEIKATSLVVKSTSSVGSAGSAADLILKNNSRQPGSALLFNLIGTDLRKEDRTGNSLNSRACDLQAAGYRILNGKLQVAIKLYEAVTSWQLCEVSVLIDSNSDSIPDQELIGAPAERLEGIQGKAFRSLLLNANQAREIRKKYEDESDQTEKKPAPPDYSSALKGNDEMKVYNSSTVALIQMDVASLSLKPTGEFSIKIATSAQEDLAAESDDFLGPMDKWTSLDINPKAQSYMNFPEIVSVGSLAEAHVTLDKSEGIGPLMILYPQNRSVTGVQVGDEQLQIIEATYKP